MNGKLLNNRYKVNDIIGTGGMAIVYDGYDTLLNRQVAIKILKESFAEDEKFFDRLKDEAKASASLTDENIVQIFDIATTEINGKSVDYIVMEKIIGPTLKEIINEKAPLDEKEIVNYALQISKALQTAHLNGLVHRDIKPANILLHKDGKLKVADFGIARVVTDATLTYTSSILGTVHYISPEQAKGQPIDSRSDLYSLGILLYEMATGNVPFDGESPVSIAVKHIQETPNIVSTINNKISDDLAYVINKLLEKNPNDRYKTASNLIIDLNKIKSGNHILDKDQTVLIKTVPEKEDISDTAKHAAVYKSKKINTVEEEEKKNKNKKLAMWIAAGLLTLLLFFVLRGAYYQFFSNETQAEESINVPSVIDISEEAAIKLLQEKGFRVSIKERVFDDNIEEGYVVDQSIKPNRIADKDDLIELTISKGKELVKVPNITGFNIDNIQNLIKKYGLEIGQTTFEESDEEDNTIIRQIPKEGETVEKGTKIDIVLSKGKAEELVDITDLTGMNIEEAKDWITNNGLIVGNISYIESDEAENNVISQSPDSGEQLAKGQKVNLEVSKGKDLVDVPNLKGLSQSVALNTIRDAGLLLGDIKQEFSNDVNENDVINQSLNPGEQVPRDSYIDITISLGQKETEIEKETETEIETETETETKETVAPPNEKTYIFNLTVPKNLTKDTFNVKINDKKNNTVVYNQDLNVNEADENGKIQVSINAMPNAQFEVLYDGKNAEVNYE